MPATTDARPSATRQRPPAVPLIAVDPYFSVWSFDDHLSGSPTRHWTGAHHPLHGMLRIDGRTYRFMRPWPHDAPAMEQVSCEVLPTRTIYVFRAAGVELTLTFTTPALPHDLDKLSWPVTYLDFELASTDGKAHRTSIFFAACSQLTVNDASQHVAWGRYRFGGVEVLGIGSRDQEVLARSGDNLRIDWGYLYLALPQGARGCIDQNDQALFEFLRGEQIAGDDGIDLPCPVSSGWPKPTAQIDVAVKPGEPSRTWLMLAYDDRYSIEYMRRKVPAYWRRDGMDFPALIKAAIAEHDEVLARCAAFDREAVADCIRIGGAGYARLAALSFRQCLAAHKLVYDEQTRRTMYFSKENFSNGCIATVDVTYPSAPFFLLFNPRLLEAQLRPVLDYALTSRWKWPYAPHDLGTYPLANGQVYGGGEKTEDHQMPVEECGNMLLLVAALAAADGKADVAQEYWALLETWAKYLEKQGYDPAGQLCTDDFAGPMAHNANLSIKAICALGAWARLCAMTGRNPEAKRWRTVAQQMADHWVREAADADHYRLAFDKTGTWSQKYNLVWDRLLGLDLFPAEVARTEMDFYKTVQQTYGLPLDSRTPYTKLDWIVWSATLTGERADFDALLAPVVKWIDEGPTRVPLTDWYWTTDGKMAGFQARSVVGGVYIPFLAHAALWTKWAKRAGSTPAVADAPSRAAKAKPAAGKKKAAAKAR